MNDWRFAAARNFDFNTWSFGKVKEIDDFYDPRIFGARQNFRCECGKYSGEDHLDIICDRCGVKVVADIRVVRRERMGHVELACCSSHPLDGEQLIEQFPICPISHRTESDGTPNELGRKYEHLLRVTDAAAAQLPPKGSVEFYAAARDFDCDEVQSAIRQIVGVSPEGAPIPESDALLGRLFHAIATLDPGAIHLARSCGLTIQIDARL